MIDIKEGETFKTENSQKTAIKVILDSFLEETKKMAPKNWNQNQNRPVTRSAFAARL